jgi:hypothetical protein
MHRVILYVLVRRFLAKVANFSKADSKEDPFNINKVVDYNIIEFMPTKYVKEFASFIL